MIDGCLGFDIERVQVDGGEPPKGLLTWIPFKGQRDPTWTPRDTGVWPVQRLSWRDLTLRRHRADLGRRPAGFAVRYAIRPVGDRAPGRDPVPVRFEREIPRVGNAIAHDKIVVIDPLSEDCVMATGNHDMGFKPPTRMTRTSSSCAETVRWRSPMRRMCSTSTITIASAPGPRRPGRKGRFFEGAIEGDDGWLRRRLARPKDISRYFLGAGDG